MSTLAVDLTVQREAFDVRAELTVASGRTLALVGPNGAGKSTILAAIAGLVDASGTLSLDGTQLGALRPEARRVAVVFQDFLLFPHLTVLDNLAFPLRVRGGGWRSARIATQPWLERFDLATLADRHPGALSGGQAQRVALARALASDPAVLLLDEPMGSLDVEIRDDVRADLARYVRDFGGPTIIVSHDRDDATALADEVAVIEKGHIVQRGTLAELAANPATPWVERFASR
jgi:molybdate transport system ATP-binding protein